MARIRTIKPEFWTSAQVASCSLGARLLFIGLWNFCDDAGIHPKCFHALRMKVFPSGDCSVKDIETWIGELLSAGLIIEYCIEKKAYWMVTGWKHQKIQKPFYCHPKPTAECVTDPIPVIEQSYTNTIPVVYQSHTSTIPVTYQSYDSIPRNGIGIGKEEERNIGKVSGETSPPSFCETDLLANTQEPDPGLGTQTQKTASKESDSNVLEVFRYWQAKLEHPNAKFDSKRKRKIKWALKDFSVEQLKTAFDGCANTPFNMGMNKEGQRYDSIDLILRDVDHIERFIRNASSKAKVIARDEDVALDGAI